MVQFTENTWKLKKSNYFSWKKMKLGKIKDMTLCEAIILSGIFTYILNILLLLGWFMPSSRWVQSAWFSHGIYLHEILSVDALCCCKGEFQRVTGIY